LDGSAVLDVPCLMRWACLSRCPSAVVEFLRGNVEWLMGAPAGFKLNKPLASILGNGILLWLNLWTSSRSSHRWGAT